MYKESNRCRTVFSLERKAAGLLCFPVANTNYCIRQFPHFNNISYLGNNVNNVNNASTLGSRAELLCQNTQKLGKKAAAPSVHPWLGGSSRTRSTLFPIFFFQIFQIFLT